MLELLKDLPNGVVGVRATGVVTREDYAQVFEPLVAAADSADRRLRLLYQFAPGFERLSPGGGLADLRLGVRYWRVFERCAVVADETWIEQAVRIFGAMMPCEVRTFENADLSRAVAWLGEPAPSAMRCRLLREVGILVVEPQGPFRAADFDALADTLDPWIAHHGSLRGVVIHTPRLPGWEDLRSLWRHLRFVRHHQDKVMRVALAADGMLAEWVPTLGGAFVHAEVRHFAYAQFDDAMAWVAAARERSDAPDCHVGARRWTIADGYIPAWSHGPEPEMQSHDTVCLLNTAGVAADVTITLYFSDRPPSPPYRITVDARRTRHLRFNDLTDPAPVPRGTDFSAVIESSVPIVAEHTRLDSRQDANALFSTSAWAG